MLTFSEAAIACGCDRRTIRRWKDSGKLPNAVLVDGVWRVPVDDLLAAGATLHAPSPPDPIPVAPDELERLRTEVAEYRRRAEVAEAVAAERAAALDDARLALRALTAGDDEERRARFTWQPGDVTVTPPAPEQPRRRWWSRR